ncbi:MAG: MCE family protein [Pseudonocardiaceae bacterium]|nr:MCE family protein [Pseudonocardiaceae bacterium]
MKVALGRVWARRRTASGLLAIILIVVLFILVYNKERIGTIVAGIVTGDDTISAAFARPYQLQAYKDDVKIGGVVVGTVIDVEPRDQGTVIVSMQLQNGVRDKLGSTPSASIRPTTLLGGEYHVDLQPGGHGAFEGEKIPLERTTIPVELGRVLSALTPPARDGMQAAIKQTDGVLQRGGGDAVRDLLQHAPGTLAPAGEVFDAVRGTRPGTDLTELVAGLESTAAALTRRDGQIAAIIASLQDSTAALAAESRPLAASVATMPETLRTTRAGLADLQPTLDRLTATAENFQPAAQALDPLLAELGPVLERTRPLLSDLRPLLDDTRPLAEQLVPTTQQTTTAFDDVRGPVLDRLNGPITQTVMSPWKGTGRYQGGGASGNRFYEELGYLAARGDAIFSWYGPNGAFGRLSFGAAGNSVGGTGSPKSMEQYLEMLGLRQPPGPQEQAGMPGLPLPQSGDRARRPGEVTPPRGPLPLLSPLDESGAP